MCWVTELIANVSRVLEELFQRRTFALPAPALFLKRFLVLLFECMNLSVIHCSVQLKGTTSSEVFAKQYELATMIIIIIKEKY